MNTSFKKIVAGVTAVTIVAMNGASFMANAANAGLTVSSAVFNGTDTITVTVAKNFSSDAVASVVLKNSAGVVNAGVTVTDVAANLNGSFTVTDAPTLGALVPDTYSLAFITVSGDYSAVVVNVGNDNTVQVTARVEPTLSFALSANAITLGTLNTDGATYVDGNITATVATNAQGGAVVTFDATGLADKSALVLKSIGALTEGTTTATADATDAYKFGINAPASGGANVAASANAVYSVANPVAPTSTIVHIGAVAGATTEAGNYSDTLTFNVTGTF